MRREFRLRLRIPRASAQFALLAALLAWPGSVLCPVQQTASMFGYIADESRPGAAVMLTTNQTTLLGSDAGSVITMVPQNCYPAKNTKVYGCTGSPNPSECSQDKPNSQQLYLPTRNGTAYNNGGGGAGSQGSPDCYNPANSATNPLRRVYLPALDVPVVAEARDPDIFRFDGDIRVDKLCFWGASGGACSTYWPLEFSACSVSGSCSAPQSCTTGGTLCSTTGTRNAIQTINYDWTIPGSTVPVPPLPQTDGTVFNPWKFKHGLVALFTTNCSGTPDQAVGTCGTTNPSGVGCEIPLHLSDGKRNVAPSPLYPPDDDANRLKRTDSVNTGNGVVTVTMNCYVIYPTEQPSQTVGKCTITIPVQNTAQSCAKYRFQPSASCTERFPNTPDNVANGLYVPCPTINISG